MKIYNVETTGGKYLFMGKNRPSAYNLAMNTMREKILKVEEVIYEVPKLNKSWKIDYANWCMKHPKKIPVMEILPKDANYAYPKVI